MHVNRMRVMQPEKVKQTQVEIEKHAELLAPTVAQSNKVLQRALDHAGERIATRGVKATEEAMARRNDLLLIN